LIDEAVAINDELTYFFVVAYFADCHHSECETQLFVRIIAKCYKIHFDASELMFLCITVGCIGDRDVVGSSMGFEC